MKVSASKKTIVILSVCFVSLLLSGLTLLYKDVVYNGIKYGRWFTLGEDDKLLDDCEYIKREEYVRLECNAFFVNYKADKESENNICLNLKLIPKDSIETITLFPCIERKNLNTKNYRHYNIPNSYFPVVVSFTYKKSGLLKYSVSEISLKEMHKNQIQELKTSLFVSTAHMIKTQKDAIFVVDNYYFVDNPIDEDGYPSITYIKAMTLKNSEFRNNKVVLTFEGWIKSELINLILEEDKFNFVSFDGSIYTISANNYTELKTNKKYQLTFLSLQDSLQNKVSEILILCKNHQDKIFMKTLCDAGEERIRHSIIKDREEYLDRLLETPLEVKPNKFIPYIFSLDQE
jgi:hypothetical protein